MKKIGIFGGAFDPPHIGHFLIAQDVYEKLELNELYFLVSYRPPHRQTKAEFEDRLKMVELMLSGSPFYVSDFESKLKFAPTYTVLVLNEWKKRKKDEELYFIMGLDQFLNLDKWYEYQTLFELSKVVVCKRQKCEIKEIACYKEKVIFLDTRIVELSSKEIRARIREGKSVHLMVHPEVENFINEKGLYLK
ncbi:MAG: nicotinate (nicotinamide) nucleotide adenylyltransferase [Candidatus Hydrothermales bacterium]